MDHLRIVSVRVPDGFQADVEFDSYIPFRFRTSRRPAGASFVRLGDLKRTLLELAIDPVSRTLTGVTLTSVGRVEEAVAPRLAGVHPGLPVLATTFTSGAQVVNVGRDFQVAIGPAGLLIRWEEFTPCATAIEWGRVRFLVSEEHLVGIWCGTLGPEERANFDAATGC